MHSQADHEGEQFETLRWETEAHVRSIVFTRGDAYNTITPQLRDELSASIDAADRDPEVRVILLRAEGKAFCAGYGLDWSTAAQGRERAAGDSVGSSVAISLWRGRARASGIHPRGYGARLPLRCGSTAWVSSARSATC